MRYGTASGYLIGALGVGCLPDEMLCQEVSICGILVHLVGLAAAGKLERHVQMLADRRVHRYGCAQVHLEQETTMHCPLKAIQAPSTLENGARSLISSTWSEFPAWKVLCKVLDYQLPQGGVEFPAWKVLCKVPQGGVEFPAWKGSCVQCVAQMCLENALPTYVPGCRELNHCWCVCYWFEQRELAHQGHPFSAHPSSGMCGMRANLVVRCKPDDGMRPRDTPGKPTFLGAVKHYVFLIVVEVWVWQSGGRFLKQRVWLSGYGFWSW